MLVHVFSVGVGVKQGGTLFRSIFNVYNFILIILVYFSASNYVDHTVVNDLSITMLPI